MKTLRGTPGSFVSQGDIPEGPPANVGGEGAPYGMAVARGNILWNFMACRAAGPCGHCEEICPTGVLGLQEFSRGGALGALCLRCRHCLQVCPSGALTFLPLDRRASGAGALQDAICE